MASCGERWDSAPLRGTTSTAQYDGKEGAYTPAADSESFRIRKEETGLDLWARKALSGKRYLKACLHDHDTRSAGIAGRKVHFFIDGKPAGTRVTTKRGVARVRVSLETFRSARRFQTRFEGRRHFLPSADSHRRGQG